jgi:hypothetical protein
MSGTSLGQVGEITEAVINALGISVVSGTPIYIGQTNIEHMIAKHSAEYVKYGAYIHDIVSTPDYVGINPGDGSIEYVKNFPVDSNFVKVAVRVSQRGKYFARSLYILNTERVRNFIANGTLKNLTDNEV